MWLVVGDVGWISSASLRTSTADWGIGWFSNGWSGLRDHFLDFDCRSRLQIMSKFLFKMLTMNVLLIRTYRNVYAIHSCITGHISTQIVTCLYCVCDWARCIVSDVVSCRWDGVNIHIAWLVSSSVAFCSGVVFAHPFSVFPSLSVLSCPFQCNKAFAQFCSICDSSPLVGLPLILPSVVSCKSPSCLQTWPIHRLFLWQIEFSFCLSSFTLLMMITIGELKA